MAFHMQVAFEKIMEFDQYLDTQSVEVYGVPNDTVVGMMKQIADQFLNQRCQCASGPTLWAGSLALADRPEGIRQPRPVASVPKDPLSRALSPLAGIHLNG